MVTVHLTVRMGSVLILSIRWSVFIDIMIMFDGDGDGHRGGDGTCKQALTRVYISINDTVNCNSSLLLHTVKMSGKTQKELFLAETHCIRTV